MKVQLMKFNVSSPDGGVYSVNGVKFPEFVSVYEKKTVENQEVLDRIGDAQVTADETGLYATVAFVVDGWKDRENVSISAQGISRKTGDADGYTLTGLVAS
jgi:hypothetical protein